MSRWSDEATLIGVSRETDAQDEDGFYDPATETETTVYCNIVSVGRSEFYRASQAGIQADLAIQVFELEYNGEKYVEIDGKRYFVVRAYKVPGKEYVELTLSADEPPVTETEE